MYKMENSMIANVIIHIAAGILWIINRNTISYNRVLMVVMRFHPEVIQYKQLFEKYYELEDYISCEFIVSSLHSNYGDILVTHELQARLDVATMLDKQ